MKNTPPAKYRIDPVKLFAAILYRDEEPLVKARELLVKRFGPEDYVSGPVLFDHTSFYETEMGASLYRIFISYQRLVMPGELVAAKLKAAAIETELESPPGRRQVNIDPGTLDYQKVVLASFKYQGQKIYLDQGVWADLTLYYRKGGWAVFEWTFPDFKAGIYDRTLLEIRRIYKTQRMEMSAP
ncbi:MAG TPA: DUF4416 family protein [archaeon]|nr:DUF4416 family protein [archaeon]